MKVYDAIMRTAAHIEQNPGQFNYDSVFIPDDTCGSPGCALGWIAHFMGMKEDGSMLNDISQRLLGIPYWGRRGFDGRMDNLAHSHDESWKLDAMQCVRALREYALKYHAADKSVDTPDWNAMASKQTVSIEAVSQELVHD